MNLLSFKTDKLITHLFIIYKNSYFTADRKRINKNQCNKSNTFS